MIHNQFEGFFGGLLPDIRLKTRIEKIMNDMFKFGNVVVNKFCTTHTAKIGAYRMLSNESFTYKDLVQGLQRACKNNQSAQHLLCIQDTTELNYTAHMDRIKGQDPDLGPVTRDDNVGFFCHPTLVVDPEKNIPIGISSIILWNRLRDKTSKYQRDYKGQPIEEKESYRWIESALQTKELLLDTPILTSISDRESDIFEQFATVPDHRTYLLVRCSRNRNLYDSKMKLYEYLDSLETKAVCELQINGNKGKTGQHRCLFVLRR